MYSIGEFSRITGLTVKTLRFYANEGLLAPAFVDPETGYRYYDDRRIETARVIVALRQLDFSVREIAEVLTEHDDESDMLCLLERQRDRIETRLRQDREKAAALRQIINHELEARHAMQTASFEVEEKTLEPMHIAGIRMCGRYEECGRAFAQLGRALGRHICGKPMLLHFDTDYKEEDADFEACMPVRPGAKPTEGISIRDLPGGRCVSLLHMGPYQELSRSYAKVLQYVKSHGYELEDPCREVYIKGPGMIFRGNPQKYLTEIQMLVKGARTA
jgi:DNA-binding transcriptional MerR regulator/effector-binding domain-containing protein